MTDTTVMDWIKQHLGLSNPVHDSSKHERNSYASDIEEKVRDRELRLRRIELRIAQLEGPSFSSGGTPNGNGKD